MKKALFTILIALLFHSVWSQSSDYIYVNHTPNFKGAHYTVPDGSGKYKVLKRNTLYSIAKMHGMSVSELKEANNIADNMIYIGQVLSVKKTTILGKVSMGKANMTAMVSESQIKQSTASSNHAVWERAKVLKSEGQSVDSLMATLINRESGEKWHIVGNEETYHSIATQYDMSFDTLKLNNEMSDYFLQSGMVLIVTPGKLYGMKEMPLDMPPLPAEEVLTTGQADSLMNLSSNKVVISMKNVGTKKDDSKSEQSESEKNTEDTDW